MTSQSSLDPRQFVDYLAGTCTAAEHEAVERWATEDPERRRLLNDLRAMWERAGQRTKPSIDLEAFVRRVEARAAVGEVSESSMRSGRRKPTAVSEAAMRGRFSVPPLHRYGWSTVTAFMLGIIVAVFGWTGVIHHNSPHSARSGLVYTTGNGERATITLPDGNTVALNVASQLQVPADYAAGNHTLHLTGEAFFSVLHHAGNPITVISGSTAARVLGTSFAVRHYLTDTGTIVAVRNGKVAVGVTVLTSGQAANVFPHGATTVRPADSAVFSFVTGTLTLPRMPLSAAIPELNRWYDADVRLGDASLGSRLLRGEFTAGSLADLVEYLQWTLNLRVVRQGRVLTLFPGR